MAMTFYDALTADSRKILDSAANERFNSVEVDDARDVIESMATHSVSYAESSYTTVGAISGESFFKETMTSQLEDLKTQLASLKADNAPPIVQAPSPIGAVNSTQPMPMICDSCGVYGHLVYACQGTQE
jgi:hypothetical protein